MVKLRIMAWGNDLGLSELAQIVGESFLAVVRGNVTMEGKSEMFDVRKTLPTIAGFEDEERRP